MMANFYGPSLSKIHDTYFGELATHAARDIVALVDNLDKLALPIIDLGCGSGILASILTGQGFRVIGVDISAEMLELARSKAPSAEFVQSSLFQYELPDAMMVTAIGESINYMTNTVNDHGLIDHLINKTYRSLAPDGYFMFDVLTTEVDKERRSTVFEYDDLRLVVDVSVDEGNSILERKMTIFSKDDEPQLIDMETHRQYLFEISILKRMLSDQGFRVREINNYNGMLFRQGHVGIVCTK